ncbi:hypothetical protein [Actinomadura monticuli]|uniref:Peptidase M15A C-terminal domain-containing protein n=1 Tax=Actinomadura monticuli TaxID=3097367 RepID=A0ABV4QAG1_9ACTN
MTRLRHAHALVRHAFGDRIPGPHGPAFRLTALAAALAFAATPLTAPPAHAAGSAMPADRRAVPASASEPGRPSVTLPALRRGSPVPGSRRPSLATAAPGPGAEPGTASPMLAPNGRPPGSDDPASAVPPGPPAPEAGQDVSGAETDSAPEDAEALGGLPELPASARLKHAFAGDVLRAFGIRWRSTGGCSDRKGRNCTSFDGVRWGTIKGLIDFAESSGCEITVTGGTERGHASGAYSHANGYKLDIAPGRCVDAAIRRHPSAGTRGDGARLHRSPDGTVFAREKDHWDITFR